MNFPYNKSKMDLINIRDQKYKTRCKSLTVVQQLQLQAKFYGG